jgi:hypothetical protein
MKTLKYVSLKTKISSYKSLDTYIVNKRFDGRTIIKKIYQYLFDVMLHNKFLEYKQETVEVKEFHYTPEKMKLISEHVAELINNYEYDYGVTIGRDTHVIICGEEEFLEAVRDSSYMDYVPFFSKEAKFPLDIRRNGQFQGFMIHVCPGVNGMIILPKAVMQK